MPYFSEGTLKTDKREIAVSETWETQSDWEAFQSASGVVVENGIVRLDETQIPDEEDLHARYDATELSLSDGETPDPWPDETGNGHDLSPGGGPTYQSDGINGNAGVNFDGSDDNFTVSFTSVSQPVHIFAVIIDNNGGSSSAEYLWDGTNSENAVSWRYGGGGGIQAINAGADVSISNVIQGEPMITNALYDGSNSLLRQNGGEQSSSGDVGTNSLEGGFTLGARADTSNNGAYDVGEILIYPMDKSGIQGDVEQYLSDKWGVTLA